MARWKLMTAAYLNTDPPSEWEYTETSRTTGKPIRKKFSIPTLLDPREPGDWTNKWGFKDDQDGEIIVCLPNKGEPTDITFLGDPTPDMTPIDDEAKTLSASFADLWRYKPEGTSVTYSQSLVDQMEGQMADVHAKPPAPVQIEGLADLVAVMAQQAAATQAILTSLAGPRRI